MRILVAGATGVVGRALLPLLREQGHHVVALLRAPGLAAPDADETVGADVLDAGSVRAAVGQAKPDVVVHQLTALRGLGGPGAAAALADTARLRAEATAHLLAGARAAGVRRFVAQSVAFAAGPGPGEVAGEDAPLLLDPPDPGWRRTFEAVAELERRTLSAGGDLEAVVLRYGVLYGPGTAYARDGSIGAALARGRLPLVGDGRGVTSFLHADDAAAAAALAVTAPAQGVYQVTDDDPAPAAEWVPHLAARYDGPPPRVLPEAMARRLLGWFPVWQQTGMRGAGHARLAGLGWRPAHPSWRAP